MGVADVGLEGSRLSAHASAFGQSLAFFLLNSKTVKSFLDLRKKLVVCRLVRHQSWKE